MAPAVQTPAWQVSFEWQAFPSSHAAPLPTFEYWEALTLGWQVSQVLVPLLAPAGIHAPPIEQKPGLSVGREHTPVEELQIPAVWQESGAVHVTWLPAVHVPAWHVSPRSHAFPSLQEVPFAAAGFEQMPVAGLHAPAT